MAIQPRISTVSVANATGARSWTATAAAQDTAAGSGVVITVTTATSGTLPPPIPDTLTLDVYIDDSNTLVASFPLAASSSTPGAPTFYFTTTGATGATPPPSRAGFVRLRLHAVNTSSATEAYNVTSDAGSYGSTANTLATGQTSTADQGYIRGTTTVVTTLNQTSYAFGDTLIPTVTLGAGPYVTTNRNVVQVTTGEVNSVAQATTTVTALPANGTINNRYAAASNSRTTVTIFGNSGLASVPWSAATTLTEATVTIDPRLTYTFLHQDNDNMFGTPPGVKDKGAQRLVSDLAFLDARVMNAAGVGQNSITWTASLQDAGNLLPAEIRSVTSATEGGQDGWGSSFSVWSDQLPSGTWNKTCTITAPAGATGLETGRNTYAYSLVAANPNYRMLVGAGPATAATDARHFTPGTPLLVGMVVFDIKNNVTLTLDTNPAPSAAIGRFNLTFGRAEYLTSDGVTWAAATGATIYYFPLTVSPGDPHAWTLTLTSTATWSVADLFIVGKCNIAGVPVAAFMKEITVSGVNNHDKYLFDGAGFIGFPSGR